MKKNVFWGFLAASVVVLCGAAIARADDQKVTANVPFDFVVGASHMPAGRYEITTVGADAGLVAIAGTDARHAMYVAATPRTVSDATAPPQLVFEKVGSQYVLVQITLEGSDGHRSVLAPAGGKPALLVASR